MVEPYIPICKDSIKVLKYYRLSVDRDLSRLISENTKTKESGSDGQARAA